jgi:hypothetical protein
MIFTTVPLFIINLFIFTTLVTFYWIVKQMHASKTAGIMLAVWLIIQAILGQMGFYEINTTIPPRFVLMILPPVLFIIILFNTKKGKSYIDGLAIEKLTVIHIIRIPVEIVLFGLFTVKLVPQIMTFEGANFDIFSGISAIIIYFFLLQKENYNRKILIVWNILCLILLFIIVGIAILSAPIPIQQLSFEQPNKGVMYFPFNWLPSFIVPVVLFSHLAALRKLFLNKFN